jgi:hypothetical protein
MIPAAVPSIPRVRRDFGITAADAKIPSVARLAPNPSILRKLTDSAAMTIHKRSIECCREFSRDIVIAFFEE